METSLCIKRIVTEKYNDLTLHQKLTAIFHLSENIRLSEERWDEIKRLLIAWDESPMPKMGIPNVTDNTHNY